MSVMPGLNLQTGWTVERVAKELGVKERTVYHHVRQKNLHPVKFIRPGVGGAPVSLFDPAEVEAFLQLRVDAKTEIVPAGDSGPLPVRQNVAVARIPAQLAHSAVALPVDRKRYLTLDEAVEYTGLGEFYIAQNCESWPIGPHRKLVFKRTDLDKL
jgi:hypothetical protein